jgi:hypothetical protein
MIDKALADISEFELTIGSSFALPEQTSKSPVADLVQDAFPRCGENATALSVL